MEWNGMWNGIWNTQPVELECEVIMWPRPQSSSWVTVKLVNINLPFILTSLHTVFSPWGVLEGMV